MIKKLFNQNQIIQAIDRYRKSGKPVRVILNSIKDLNTKKHPLEAILPLQWIFESLIKKILENNNVKYSNILSKNLKEYFKLYPHSLLNKYKIKEVRDLRNYFQHGGVIRDNRMSRMINSFILAIEFIAMEANIDLNSFVPQFSIEDMEKFAEENKIEEESEKKSYIKYLIIPFSAIVAYYFFVYQNKITFLTGSPTGTYYLIAQDIKKTIASNLTVLKSEGSMDNLKHIGLSKESNPIITFVQNDVLKYLSKEAHSGDIDKQKILNKTKILMPIYDGEIHILVREDNLDIQNFRDLKDKKISIGMKDSGTAITAKALYFKLFHEEIDKIYQPFKEALKALKDRSIDAVILTGGQPLSKLNKNRIGVRLISYKGEPLDGYSIGYIKKSSYPWLKEEKIRTLSVKSFIVTNIDSNRENLLYLKEFLEKLKEYKINLRNNKDVKVSHPKLKDLAQQRCLPSLPIGLEYHQFVKWDTPWCKK